MKGRIKAPTLTCVRLILQDLSNLSIYSIKGLLTEVFSLFYQWAYVIEIFLIHDTGFNGLKQGIAPCKSNSMGTGLHLMSQVPYLIKVFFCVHFLQELEVSRSRCQVNF